MIMNAVLLDVMARSPLDVVIRATLILAATGAVAIAMRRASAAARHLAWCLGLGAALVLPAVNLALPVWSWRVLPMVEDRSDADRVSEVEDRKPVLPGSTTRSTDALDDEESLLGSGAVLGSSSPTPAGSPVSHPRPSWRLPLPSWSWLWAAWLAGVLAVLSAPIAGWFSLRRLMRNSVPIVDDESTALARDLAARLGLRRRVLLRRVDATMPMTWGWIRPVVLLPSESESWGDDRRRGVLLHELAHIKRLDCLTQAIALVSCAIYWFHPLAWISARRMRVERERACDDVVLMAGARASEYAAHLLEIARQLRIPRASAMAALTMARPSQLEGRLRAILDPSRPRRGPGRGMALIALLTAALMVLPLATLRLDATTSAATASPQVAENPPPKDPANQMTLTGRVLDPNGKPVPDAAVMVIVRSKYSSRPWREQTVAGALSDHEGRTDAEGRFRIAMPRTSSARQYGLVVTAMASGYGIGWTDLDPDADPPTADVRLTEELVVRGRMFDVKGEPARGVALRIELLSRVERGRMLLPIARPDLSELRRRDFPGWPGPATSDEEGRFALRGLSRDLMCRLFIEDPRFAIPTTYLQTAEQVDDLVRSPFLARIKVDPGPEPKPIAIALQPARTVVGRITHAETGQPFPHALVATQRSFDQADADGRFRISLGPGPGDRFGVRAQPPDGAPYLLAFKRGEWPRGAIEQTVDVALTRGVVVRGKVTEEGTGRPVEGAVVRIAPYPSDGMPSPGMPVPGVTGPDGSYRVAAPPGPGNLVVQGPDDDYVLVEFSGDGGWYTAGPGRERFYAHAYRAIDLKPDGPEQKVDLTLRRGVALHGRAIGPDEKPVRDGWVCSRLQLRTQPDGGWKLFILPQDHSLSPVRDGRFVLHGLDPNSDVEVPAYFLDAERKLGATARFSGRMAAEGQVMVRFESCGTASARLVTPDGKPLARYPALPLATLVVTPGAMRGRDRANGGPPMADEAGVAQLDPVNYGRDFQSDAQGRVTWPALIPGATYRVEDRTPLLGGGEAVIRKEFTVKPGETIDLGDIVIARPRPRNPQ